MHALATIGQRPIIRFEGFTYGLPIIILLAIIAGYAAGYAILPIGLATFTQGMNMINV